MQSNEAVSRLIGHANKHALYGPQDTVLLAVSAGRDSMCMLTLFEESHQPFGVAHMNFQLRGEESNRDALFIENYCSEHSIKFHRKNVDCRAYMAEHHKGLQEAARDLRYAWMSTLLEDESYQVIATAHHRDDNVETLLINLMRGTGIRGMKGIPVKRPPVVRPMMCFDSREIQTVVEECNIEYCQDSSNAKDDYLRNRIRHHLVPLLNEIKPGASQNMMKSIVRIKGQLEALEAVAATALSKLSVLLDASGGSIQLDTLKSYSSSEYLLSHLVERYGFSVAQCASIMFSNNTSGTGVYSSTHEMILNRNIILIKKISTNKNTTVLIHIGDTVSSDTGLLEITSCAPPEEYSPNPNIEYIDEAKFQDPGMIRNWLAGDRFSPIGMNGSQNISDLLTNLKFSTFEKRDVKVLVVEGEIVWVIGVRLSDKFKVGPQTKGVLRLVWTPST